MPPSMPEDSWASRCSGRVCSTSTVMVVTPSRSSRVIVLSDGAIRVGVALEHLSGHEAVRGVDLAVLAVEADLHAAVADDVAPRAAHPEVDLADVPLRGLEAPPPLHQLGCGEGTEDGGGRRIEE